MASVGLLEAIDDLELLGAGFTPHPRQRELLEAIERSRIVVACCGRRFGKTKATAAAALHNLLLVPELDGMVAKGEKRYAVSVANSQSQARIFLEHAASIVKASPALAGELLEETQTELVFTGGRTLAAFPTTGAGIRGWAASFLCFDELAHAFAVEDGGPATAERLWAGLTPAVAQFGDLGRVVAISTPLGDSGLFADVFAKARGGELPKGEAFHAATSENPLIDADYLAAQEATLGHDDYRREYGAEFLAGGSSFLEPSRIRDVVGDWRERLPTDGVGWILAFDPSFSRDPAAAVVVGRDPWDRGNLIVGHAQRWLPPKQRRRVRRTREQDDQVIAAVLDDVAALAARFQARVVTDQHLPGVTTHELAKRGVHATVRAWTPQSRTEAAQALRARIYTGRIELPDDPQLVAELSRLRSKVRAGSASIELPRVGDSHCDLAAALMAAVGELDRWGVRSEPLPEMSPPSSRSRAIANEQALNTATGDHGRRGGGDIMSREF